MVNENATYNGKKCCRVIFLGTKQKPYYEETIYSNIDDFIKMYGFGLKKIEE